MALQIKDRIRETSTTTGTGTYTLAGAVTGFLPFSEISDGDTTYYLAERDSQWEVGLGTVGGSGTTLARTTILRSSNSDAAVDWGSGTKQIAVIVPAALLSVLAEVTGTLAETIRDTIGTALVAGTGLTKTVDDGGDTITIDVTAMTASRAVVTDGSGNLSVSAVTATELGYVSGATSNLQAQITALQALTIRQPKVIARVDNTAAPPTEVTGDRYLLDATGSSHADWDGAAANSIVEFDGSTWDETTPAEGWVVYNDDTDTDWLAVDDGTLTWQERSTSVTSLNGLLDVIISSPSSGEYLRYNGTNWVNAEILAADISDPENLSLTHSQISDFAEGVDDRVNALLVEGSGVSLTYDDGAGTLTITASGSGENNTASNVGASGIGVFHQKSGVDLQLRKLVGGDTNTIDVTLNSNVVEFDLDAGLADLNDVDDSLTGTAGDILYHDADDWTDLGIGTEGDVLQVVNGLPAWDAGALPKLATRLASAGGNYLSSPSLPQSPDFSYAMTTGTLFYVPVYVTSGGTATELAIDVDTTGTATMARLGIYDAAGGLPGDLVLDAGEVAIGTTGTKTITISQSLDAGLYWLALTVDGSVTVTAWAGDSILWHFGHSTASPAGGRRILPYEAHTYGALPASADIDGALPSPPPYMAIEI